MQKSRFVLAEEEADYTFGQAMAVVGIKSIKRYSEDQPRDDDGKWTDGGDGDSGGSSAGGGGSEAPKKTPEQIAADYVANGGKPEDAPVKVTADDGKKFALVEHPRFNTDIKKYYAWGFRWIASKEKWSGNITLHSFNKFKVDENKLT